MKKSTKIIALIMAVILAFGCLCITSLAADDSITVKMVTFNVAGLPSISGIIGQEGADVPANQKAIAEYLNANDFDIIATQEDFGYHKDLVSNLNGYNYQTRHSGSFIGGDGMNIFTKTMPIYNQTRTKWDKSYGIIENGADELARKGILYAVIDIGDGIYVDFYDIHADAYGGQGDIEARESNYAQVAAIIQENYEKNNRPVIINGDFNQHFHTTNEVNSNMRKYFIRECGLKDAWIELYNDGNYTDFSKWSDYSQAGYWGIWDSVEKFMYKDGGGVTVTPSDFKYTWVKNANNENVSDHAAAECTFTFTKTADFVENAQPLTTKISGTHPFFVQASWLMTILSILFANFDEVIKLLNK